MSTIKVKIINVQHSINKHLIGTIINVMETPTIYYIRADGSNKTILKEYTIPVPTLYLGGE